MTDNKLDNLNNLPPEIKSVTLEVKPDDIKPVKEKKESVSLTKEQYDNLMERMSDLQKKVDYVADKDRLERFDAVKNAGKNVLPTVKISTIDDKIVVGWRTISNEAEFRNGIYFERQITEVTFEDQTTQKMDLVEFYRQKKTIPAEITKRSVDGISHNEVLTVRLADGRELNIGLTYVN